MKTPQKSKNKKSNKKMLVMFSVNRNLKIEDLNKIEEDLNGEEQNLSEIEDRLKEYKER